MPNHNTDADLDFIQDEIAAEMSNHKRYTRKGANSKKIKVRSSVEKARDDYKAAKKHHKAQIKALKAQIKSHKLMIKQAKNTYKLVKLADRK